MTGKTQLLRLSVVLTLVIAIGPASAWGPRAQRTITGMAIQVIQGKYPGTFRPGDSDYTRDVLMGAEAGWPVISKSIPIHSDAEAIQAVASEIELLRDVRSFGAGSYFAYRLGALSTLVSDIMLPYGLAWDETSKSMKAKIDRDIEENLNSYRYTNSSTERTLIINATEYFGNQMHFYNDNKMIVADDYKRGRGYNGLLKQSSKSQFQAAIDAVSDAWYTILTAESKAKGSVTSDLLAGYFVDEIAYQLGEKRNFHQAGVVYENLETLNSLNPEYFEEIGDLYYAFDTKESAERSVKEWKKAFELGGPNREQASRKISDHYLREGQNFLQLATEKGAGETELPSALAAFKNALQYNRTSEEAADLIQSTNTKIKERNERREMIVDIIAKAEQVKEEAQNQATGGNYGNAIGEFNRAKEILTAVDDEFTDQATIAKDMTQTITQNISKAISDVQEQAGAAIEKGEALEEQHKYEDAIQQYKLVPTIVSVIPEDHNNTATQDKKDIIVLSETKVAEATNNKARYEASQAAGAPGAPGAGAMQRPGAAAPAAAGTAPALTAPPAAPALRGRSSRAREEE